MKISIFSDIHDQTNNFFKAIKLINQQKVVFNLFCGDLTSPATAKEFKKLKTKTYAVFGNRDWDSKGILQLVKDNNLQIKYPFIKKNYWQIKIKNKTIALCHGHNHDIIKQLLDQSPNFLFTGHTHRQHLLKRGKSLWLNPGPVCGWVGLDFQPYQPSFAVLNIQSGQAKIINI